MRRFAALALIVSFIALACGGPSGGGASDQSALAPGKDVKPAAKITWWHAMTGVNGDALNKIVDGFNKSQSAIKVEAVFQGTYDDLLSKLNTALASNAAPALVQVYDIGQRYMYDSGGTYHFMNSSNYDQIEMDEESLGDNAPWMQPGMKIQAEFYDGKPIGVRLPNSMTLTIVETNPVMKTATKTASSKPAKLENGVTVNVPEFVGTGDKVRVNPTTGEYMDRAKD